MSVTSSAAPSTGDQGLVRKLVTYAAGSGVATVCSEVTVVVCYGLLHLGAGPASVLGWLAGAIPNYWINRTWTWRRSGRPSLRGELVPYVAIVLVTLSIAVGATHVVSVALRDESDATRTWWVGVTYFGVFVMMSIVRYVLFDRLFTRLPDAVRLEEGDSR